jgi:hypothetical protein
VLWYLHTNINFGEINKRKGGFHYYQRPNLLKSPSPTPLRKGHSSLMLTPRQCKKRFQDVMVDRLIRSRYSDSGVIVTIFILDDSVHTCTSEGVDKLSLQHTVGWSLWVTNIDLVCQPSCSFDVTTDGSSKN